MKTIRTITTAIIWGAAFSALTLISYRELSAAQIERTHVDDSEAELLYLPSGRGLTAMSFGYRNAVAGILWLDTVSYFGKHYSSNKRYDWLAHRCKLVTSLNPRVFDPYYFCSTMLAWESNQPQLAVSVLNDAVTAHPDEWFFLYLRGFYEMYFLKDGNSAKRDFGLSSQKTGAPPITARLAAKEISELESPETAIAFLRGMIKNSHDELERTMLTEKLNHLIETHPSAQSGSPS